MSTILGNPLSIGGGGAKIGVTLNEDGTQHLFLTDNNTDTYTDLRKVIYFYLIMKIIINNKINYSSVIIIII